MSDRLGAKLYPNEAAPDRREQWRESWHGSGLLTNLPPDKATAALAAWSPSADPVKPAPRFMEHRWYAKP
jgi:hypothetical protein